MLTKIFAALSFINKILALVDKWYDEYIRKKWFDKGVEHATDVAHTKVLEDMQEAEKIADEVDKLSDEDVADRISDPRPDRSGGV